MENLNLCKECKGQCCKNSSGRYLLEELSNYKEGLGVGLSVRVEILLNPQVMGGIPIPDEDKVKFNLLLKNGLATGRETATFFLTVKPKGEMDVFGMNFIGSNKNKCSLLTDNGCTLSHDSRPYECKELVPNKVDGRFECGGSRKNVKIERSWLSEQEYLRDYVVGSVIQMLRSFGCETVDDVLTKVKPDIMDTILAMFENDFHGIVTKFEKSGIKPVSAF